MEMVGELLLTKEGFDKLENELKYLKTVKRLKIAEQLKEALSYGDIVDNTEYEDAKNNQAFVEGRIITIEKLLYNARPLVIDSDNGHRVALGSTVRLKTWIIIVSAYTESSAPLNQIHLKIKFPTFHR
jgi:transcription elongation factor GreA